MPHRAPKVTTLSTMTRRIERRMKRAAREIAERRSLVVSSNAAYLNFELFLHPRLNITFLGMRDSSAQSNLSEDLDVVSGPGLRFVFYRVNLLSVNDYRFNDHPVKYAWWHSVHDGKIGGIADIGVIEFEHQIDPRTLFPAKTFTFYHANRRSTYIT